MTNFTRAKKTLQEHSAQKTHWLAAEDAVAFVGHMSGHLTIGQQLQVQASETQAKNRVILKSILRAIIFCGRQNIALRGHDEHCSFDEMKENPGNFRALLKLQIESGDKVLKDHFPHGPRNALYHSRTRMRTRTRTRTQTQTMHCVSARKACSSLT